MELRPEARQKENVSPRPATPLRPEQRRLPKSPGVVLGSGPGQWVPRGRAERGEPATTRSPRAALRREPCQVQTNLASPRPHLGLALKDTTGPGRLSDSRSQRQQSNLQPPGALPLRGARAFAVQQRNLGAWEAGLAWSEPQESFWPHGVPRWGSPRPPGPPAQPSSILKPSWPLATDTPCPRFRPAPRYAPTEGHTQPGPGSWGGGGLGNWASRLRGDPLTLDDLAVPVKSPAWGPPQASTSRLLASVQHREQEAARLGCWGAREPPGPSPQEPWTSGGQAPPAGPQSMQPVLAFCAQRKKHLRGLRGAVSPPETPGVQAGLSGSQASSKPASPRQTALEVLTGGFLDPVQGLLPASPLIGGKRPACSRGQSGDPLLPQEVGSRGARLRSPTFSRAAWGTLPEQEGGEQGRGRKRDHFLSSGLGPAINARQNKAGNPVTLASERAGRQLLSRCLRAWQRLTRRRQAGARPSPSGSGPRPEGGDGMVQTLQALQPLAVFLLQCQQEEWARLEQGVPGEASRARLRAQSLGRPPQTWCSPAADTAWVPPGVPQHRRAWLQRCFGAWRRSVERGAQHREPLADRQRGALRVCLKRWVWWTKQLRASEGARVTRPSLARQKEGMQPLLPGSVCGYMDLGSSGGAKSHGLSPFFQGEQRHMLRRILRAWRLRVWGPGHRADRASTTSASGLLGSTRRSPPEGAPRAPALLETLRLSFLRAAGRRWRARCLLLWRARARRSRGAARWHQHTLQRRILLGWSHCAVAHGARRRLAARRAWARSCGAALGLWRRRLAQRREAERRAQERGRSRVRGALQRWRSSWQRQQCLHARYQRWAQLRRQGLRRATFQSWRRAAAQRRRRMARPERLAPQSHSPAGCVSARDVGMCRARWQAPQAGPSGRALGAAFATWRAARGQRCEAGRRAGGGAGAQSPLAPCWTRWVRESRLHRLSRAHAARKLSARVLEAWAQSAAQGCVQRVAITQFQLVGHRGLLRTQWRTELLRVWLEPRREAQETSTALPRPREDLTHWRGLAGRGCLLALMDTAAPWKQTHSCWPQGMGPGLPSPAHRSFSGQRTQGDMSWARSDSAAPLWMQWPGPRAQGPPPPGPGGDCSSGGQGDERGLGRKYLRRWHHEALLRRLQGSQQARHLAGTWQRWVDAQGAEELARSLLRQWQLRWVWRTWRRRVVQLQVAGRLRRRAEGWVLSQAFERWHQRVAARGPRRSHQQLETPE